MDIKTKRAFSFAGFLTDREDIDREFPSAGQHAPQFVRLSDDGKRLVWGLGSGLMGPPPRNLLTRFISLRDASPAEICRFAQECGVLQICRCGRPMWDHEHDTGSRNVLYEGRGSRPFSTSNPLGMRLERSDEGDLLLCGWEPISAWRYYIRQAIAILNVAANVHRNSVAEPADLATLAERLPLESDDIEAWFDAPTTDNEFVELVAGQQGWVVGNRQLAAHCVHEWLHSAGGHVTGVNLSFYWGDDGPGFAVTHDNLLSVIGFQIALTISRAADLAVCSGCFTNYIPKRRPRPEQRNYCDSCRRGKVPIRDAMRDRRARLKLRRNEGENRGESR